MSEQSLRDLAREAVNELSAVRDLLTRAVEAPAEPGKGSSSETLLQSAVGCVILDSLEPAIRDLVRAVELPPWPATIRPATVEDFEGLYRIVVTTPEVERSEGSVMIPEDFEEALRDPQGVFLLAEHGDTIAAFIYAVQETSITATIRYLVTEPHLRRRGIASALLRRCLALLAEELDVKEVGVFAPSGPAVMLLEANHFRRGGDHVWMSLELPAEPRERQALSENLSAAALLRSEA